MQHRIVHKALLPFGKAEPSRRTAYKAWAAAMAPPEKVYKLSGASSLALQQGDLTKVKVNAIVNAANERMLGGGGVDGAIHNAAGRDLLRACEEVPEVSPGVRCPTGEARITEGFRLPARFVIHTVGPVYKSKQASEPLLFNAYKYELFKMSSLKLANEKHLQTIAFPAISCGVYGYPLPEAARVSLEACKAHAGSLERVSFVLFGDATYRAYVEAADELLKS